MALQLETTWWTCTDNQSGFCDWLHLWPCYPTPLSPFGGGSLLYAIVHVPCATWENNIFASKLTKHSSLWKQNSTCTTDNDFLVHCRNGYCWFSHECSVWELSRVWLPYWHNHNCWQHKIIVSMTTQIEIKQLQSCQCIDLTFYHLRCFEGEKTDVVAEENWGKQHQSVVILGVKILWNYAMLQAWV